MCIITPVASNLSIFDTDRVEPDDHDLLGRLYEDFELWGGVEVRLGAADSDVLELAPAARAVPTLEEARARIYGGGRLPDSGAEPGEMSLALTDDPSEMRVSWATMDRTVENARVEFEAPCPAAGCSFPASTATYSVPKRWWPQFNGSLHSTVVPGLDPGASYTYRVGSDSASPGSNGTGAFSKPFTFRARAPAGGENTHNFCHSLLGVDIVICLSSVVHIIVYLLLAPPCPFSGLSHHDGGRAGRHGHRHAAGLCRG